MNRTPMLMMTTLLVATACRPIDKGVLSLHVERDTTGDTVAVRIVSGSIWKSAGHLEEELRIGAAEGDEEYVFGDIVELTPDASGGVYVFDRQVPALRHYNGQGRFVETLGRKGDGPGEYRAIVGMAMTPDGRLVVHDAQNRRVTFYAPDGIPNAQWPANSGLFIDRALMIDSLDHVYVKAVTIPGPRDPQPPAFSVGLLHFNATGELLDTVYPPRIAGEPMSTGAPLAAEKVWALHSCGTIVGVNNTYAFEVRRPNGKVMRVVRSYHPVRLAENEWEAYEARRHWEIAHEGPTPEHAGTTPRTKPAYRSLQFGQDCRIWVHKYMPGVPRPVDESVTPGSPPEFPFEDPVDFDVFAANGDYLGAVTTPPRTSIEWIGSDVLYGIQRGKNDQQYVVRFRLITNP